MNKILSPIASIAVVIVLGALWLKFIHDPAVRRQAEMIREADSLQIVQEQQDSLNREFDGEREAILGEIMELEGEKASLLADLARATRHSGENIAKLDSILATDGFASDSLREAVTATVAALQQEIVACNSVIEACESQNRLFSAQLAADTAQIRQIRDTNRELNARVQELLRQGARKDLGLTVITTYNTHAQTVDIGGVYQFAEIFGVKFGAGVTFKVFGG